MGAQEWHSDPEREDGSGTAAPQGIVVGVDGSEHGQCALVWATGSDRGLISVHRGCHPA